ncbi:methyltransferase-like protein 4 isoform X1 [Bombyx mandarina]|uniref:Methyltransferase-like protein 4 isoform X1 n=1 Tax=Bombyx mandarina TaxID=7092 RepID=A0A6J2J7V6_BOMMA|nr:methyltransferase-like protein 4 isoform X1 [Bombyx mandarina]
MSLVIKQGNCCLIDHWEFIAKLYKDVLFEENYQSYTLSAKLFSITSEVRTRKRKKVYEELSIETSKIKRMYEEFIAKVPNSIKERISQKYNILDTSSVRDFSASLFQSTIFDHHSINGGSTSDIPLKCKIQNEYFLIPPNSRFYYGSVNEECHKLDNGIFDLVIADPPWWNRYIRRLKNANEQLSYEMMYNEDIAAIPLSNLLSSNCLVAVWCTNSPANIQAVKNLIFRNWGVRYVASWHWLKVAVDLSPICPFGTGSTKQPYEMLIIGKVGSVAPIPDGQLIVSIPSALHSHKPPLLDLLKPYINKEQPRILELFARYLLPDTTSVGYEPLKWQHISLYETVDISE